MSTQVQSRRGTTAQHAGFTGAVAEITVDTDKDVAVVHDGATAGGFPLAKETHTHVMTDVSDITAAARTILDDTTIAAIRATLVLVVGTDVQAYSAKLAALAALTWAADKFAYMTSTSALATTDLSSFARTLLAVADAAAGRTALALGTMATQAASAVAISGGTITGLGTPSVSSDAANKSYVDNLIAGLKWKATVKAATTANGTLATAYEDGDALDGVTLATGDRILLKDQTPGSENVIYTVNASGAPTRATDADAGSELVSACCIVEQGTANADLAYVCTNNSITIGATSIVFVAFSGSISGALLATNNLSDVANAGTSRTNLGLAIGSDVQAYNAKLAAIVALTWAADKLPYFTSSSAIATADLSTFARTLIDDANQGAMQTTLGLVPGTDVQAYSAKLAAIAALTWAADKLAYQTGTSTTATTDLSSFARTFLDDANAAAVQTTLGVVPGTDVQAYSAKLAAIAALTWAADKLPYFTSSSAVAAADLSTFGRSLIDDADAGTARTTLGLGSLATQSGTFSGTSSGTNTGDQTSVSGNAGTATALQTARTINGVSFDGSANITLPDVTIGLALALPYAI